MNKYRYQDAELVALVKDCVSNSQTHWESDIAKSRIGLTITTTASAPTHRTATRPTTCRKRSLIPLRA